LYKTDCRVRIEHSIIGSIQVFKDEVKTDPLQISISDSILDATSDEREALGAPNLPRAHATLSVARCTVFGRIATNGIGLADGSICNGKVTVPRHQTGCVRFCYVAPGSRTPRRYNCQPDLVEAVVREVMKSPGQAEEREQVLAVERLRVQPQ